MKSYKLDDDKRTYKLPFEAHSGFSFSYFIVYFFSITFLTALCILYFYFMREATLRFTLYDIIAIASLSFLVLFDLYFLYNFFFCVFGFGKIKIDSSGVYLRTPFMRFFESWNNITDVECYSMPRYKGTSVPVVRLNTLFGKRIVFPQSLFSSVSPYTLQKTIAKYMYQHDTTYYKVTESEDNADTNSENN